MHNRTIEKSQRLPELRVTLENNSESVRMVPVTDELSEARKVSRHTYRAYGVTIRFVTQYMERKLRKSLPKIQTDDLSFELVSQWMLYEKRERAWSASTWNRHLAAIKTFVQYLARINVRYMNLSARVSLIKSQRRTKKQPDYLRLDELDPFFANEKYNGRNLFRDQLIPQLLFFSGMRVEELTGIRFQDLVWSSPGTVCIYIFGKGRKERTSVIKEKATVQNLKTYVDQLTRKGLKSEFLFAGRHERRMSEENVRRILKKFKIRDVEQNITPHSMRHSAAMNWTENGMGIFNVSINLGHEDISTTQRYFRSTLNMKVNALKAAGQDKKLSKIFTTNFLSEDEFWESIGVKQR